MKTVVQLSILCAFLAYDSLSFALTIDIATQSKLGIRSQVPQPLPAASQYMPAQVFVPQQNQQQVSLSHAVTLLAWRVEPYQMIQTDQPLAQLFSNTLLEASHAWLIARNKEQLIGQQFKREKSLFEQGLTPKKRLDMAQSEHEQAQFTTHMAAQQCLHLGLSEKALLEMAKQGAATGEFTLLAKDSGRIVKLHATQGRSITSGEALLSYQSGDARWLEFSLSALDAHKLSAGDTFSIQDSTYTATLIGQQPERNTSQKVMFLAKINHAPDLMPGQWVSLQLNQVVGKTFEVPRQAITHLDNKPYLFVLNGNEIHKIAVEVLGSTRSGWQVRSDVLADTDKIIVQGGAAVKALFDGSSHE